MAYTITHGGRIFLDAQEFAWSCFFWYMYMDLVAMSTAYSTLKQVSLD